MVVGHPCVDEPPLHVIPMHRRRRPDVVAVVHRPVAAKYPYVLATPLDRYCDADIPKNFFRNKPDHISTGGFKVQLLALCISEKNGSCEFPARL